MKRVMYVLGMTLVLCCCSTKEEKSPDSVTTEVKSESNVKPLYSFYDFCQENPGCEISGFSGNEDFGRWSNGDTATIELMAVPKAEVTVKLDVDRIICPDEPLRFDVEVNGEKISHFSTNGNSTVFVNVPKENLGADGSIRMMFIFENAAKPGKYNPENHDGRKLGFALRNVTVYGYCLNKD